MVCRVRTNTTMKIRPETDADIQAIFDLTKVAFAPMSFADENDPFLPQGLRDAGDLLLSLVMEDAGQIIGHVAFSPVSLECPGKWVGLGPISVMPGRQRQGLGTKLANHGLAQLADQGFDGCVLIGNRDVYGPMGFTSGDLAYRDLPTELVMGRSFTGLVPSGRIVFAPALEA